MSYTRDQAIALAHRIFQAEKYEWVDTAPNPPTYEQMESLFSSLEESCIENKNRSAESGRIRVEYDKESQSFEYYLHIGYDY